MPVPGVQFLRNLVERRSLLFQLVRRDFQQRFIGSAVGWIWGVIHPLVLLVSWWFVFEHLMQFKLPPNQFTNNYPLYLFAECCHGCCSAIPYSVPPPACSINPT
ncbi:MAG: hypothetical protein WDO73_05305 [Ignavibacteriota bacterium]